LVLGQIVENIAGANTRNSTPMRRLSFLQINRVATVWIGVEGHVDAQDVVSIEIEPGRVG
jgi:hypothetical protein